MAIYTPPNMTSGIDDALVGTAGEVYAFTPSLCLFIFLVVLLGGSIAQKRRIGSADVPMWMTYASLSTLMVALIMTLTTGLIQLGTLSVIVGITIFSGVWLYLDRNRNEI
jgi:uncharacterized membrane protein YgdD (TMEM256/DUF423 family)